MRRILILLLAAAFMWSCAHVDSEPFPRLSARRLDALWNSPARATLEELYSATSTAADAKDWERAVFFLWCSQVRLQFEQTMFPPKEKGGNSPTLSLFAIGQMFGQSSIPMLYASPESHRRAISRFRDYVPHIEKGYRPMWSYDSGVTREEADLQAKKAVAAIADSSARILDLTAIPEYLESLKIYTEPWDESPERVSRFRAANETMWRIEEEKKIKSGLAYPPRMPNKAPEPTPTAVTPRAME